MGWKVLRLIYRYSEKWDPQSGEKLSEKNRRCSCRQKQCKTLLKYHLLRRKITLSYMYKDEALRILGLMNHVTIIVSKSTYCPAQLSPAVYQLSDLNPY